MLSLFFCTISAQELNMNAVHHEDLTGFQKNIAFLDLEYNKPETFIESHYWQKPTKLRSSSSEANLPGTAFTLTSINEDVLIYLYLMPTPCNMPVQYDSLWFPGRKPEDNQNYIIARLADTVSQKIKLYNSAAKNKYKADVAGEYVLEIDIPYEQKYTHAKAVFFSKKCKGDIQLIYFFRDGVNIDSYLKKAYQILRFKD